MLSFSARIKECRTSANLTQVAAAKEFNLAWRTWQDYEAGKRTPPLNTLIALADYFDVSLDYLVGRSDNPKVNPEQPAERL